MSGVKAGGFDSLVQRFQFSSPSSSPASSPVPSPLPDGESKKQVAGKKAAPQSAGSGLDKLRGFSFSKGSPEFVNLQSALRSRESIASKFD